MSQYALNTVDDFIVRLNGIEVSDIRKLLYSSLASASLQLAMTLRTNSFDEITGAVDEYSIDKQTAFRDERYLSLKLTNGFVNTATNAVAVVFGTTKDDLDSATALDAEYVRVDKEKGLVIIDLWGLHGSGTVSSTRLQPSSLYQYLFRVTYDSGLATKATADGKVYTGVPLWLSELSLLKAREIYHYTNPILNSDGAPLDAKSFSMNSHIIIENNIRLFSLALNPII